MGADGSYSTYIKNGQLSWVLRRILELSEARTSGEMVLGLAGGVVMGIRDRRGDAGGRCGDGPLIEQGKAAAEDMRLHRFDPQR